MELTIENIEFLLLIAALVAMVGQRASLGSHFGLPPEWEYREQIIAAFEIVAFSSLHGLTMTTLLKRRGIWSMPSTITREMGRAVPMTGK